ncbi:uridine phosphorylase [Anaerobacterium chartisolvens]|uniref:Uridine phosphorylase n=1 Tax=Anaerobacterium chartisolvens TaxID=1297424 RepID=A0A369BEM9_9FIRM|nr:nucleoside phosphorylase [Anaerobacterium chartisolvens]RCX20013.1 uridine phosphorylase [Anaerobacterium chartisolvens]
METLYLHADKDNIAKYVIFSGDPWRVETLSKLLDNAKHVAFSREFNTYTGTYKGMPVTVSSTGIGAPSAAIAMEEMYQCGMEIAVRMGTTMGLKDDMLGKLVIPTGAMREESTGTTYVPLSYPAVADIGLINCMNKSVVNNGRSYLNGITCTMDGFYSQMRQSRLSEKMQVDINETFDRLKKYNVLAADMESSCMLVLANLMGIKACIVTMTTVLENLKDMLRGDDRKKSEEDLCKIVLDGLRIYNKEAD